MMAVRLGSPRQCSLVVAGYATLAARWTSAESDWYRSLPRPRWQPPDLVFGVIWPLNFGALAVVGLAVALERPPPDGLRWLVLFTASVALALGWAHAFYRRHDLGRAAVLLGGGDGAHLGAGGADPPGAALGWVGAGAVCRVAHHRHVPGRGLLAARRPPVPRPRREVRPPTCICTGVPGGSRR